MCYSRSSALATTPAYMLSNYIFTGQYSYMDDLSTPATEGFGLMFYNARFYDPALGRFTSADTIVPGGVQGLDRYAYVNNNPIRHIDPSGHRAECSDDACDLKLPKNNKTSNNNGLTDTQIMQLMGFDDLSDFNNWKNNGSEMYKLLQAANPGNSIRTSWLVNGNTETKNWMITYHGQAGGDLAFYDTDRKELMHGSLLTSDMLQGAGILSDSDGDGVYSTTGMGNEFGNVDMNQYTLSNGWNRHLMEKVL